VDFSLEISSLVCIFAQENKNNSILMTDVRPRYPVGMQIFSEIREGNFMYVDKTELIYRMTHGDYKNVFLSRPRRFGKTLLTRTLQSYFEGHRELFTGLAMEKLETEWIKYPVIRFDFGSVKGNNLQELKDELNRQLNGYEKLYGTGRDENSPGQRLNGMIQRAYEKTGKKVVVLVDEYDAPLLEVLAEPEKLGEVRSTMRNFYSQIKNCDEYIRFAFLTGISTFSQLGMFSELNNLKNISDIRDYSAICGITLRELKENFQYGIREFSEQLGCTYDEIIEMLKEQYDGYHFTDAMVDVFNPYSLLNAFSDCKLNSYWFQTGTPSFAINMLRMHKEDWNFNIENIEGLPPMSSVDFNTPLEQAVDPIPFLYQAGYLTIKSYDKEYNNYVLGVPNTEVRIGLMRNLIPLYSSMSVRETANTANNVSVALSKGDYERAMCFIQSFLAGIPFLPGDKEVLADELKCEAYYHKVFYIVIAMLNNGARGQVRQALGVPDIVIETRKYIYVIELKINSSPEVALRQLEDLNYALPFAVDGREVIKLGVNFSTASRTIDTWKRGK
jgi:hypothetical protein